MMLLINNEAQLFLRLQCRKDEGSIFCAKKMQKNHKKRAAGRRPWLFRRYYVANHQLYAAYRISNES